MFLPIMGTGIGQKELAAMQALAFAPSSHRQILSKSAHTRRTPPQEKEIPPSSEDGNKKTKKIFFLKGTEENPAEENRFSNRHYPTDFISPLTVGVPMG